MLGEVRFILVVLRIERVRIVPPSAMRSRVWAGGVTMSLFMPVVVGLLVWVPVLVLLDDCMLGVDCVGAVWAKAT